MGGGVTHLVEILAHADPAEAGVSRVSVFAPADVLEHLPRREWLVPMTETLPSRRLPARIAWQMSRLSAIVGETADVLFVAGGSYSGRFQPFVTVAQNMLPFDASARSLYPRLSRRRARNALLRALQGSTMKRAAGVIFLSEYDREVVVRQLGGIKGEVAVIPHGVTPGIVRRREPATGSRNPFRWVYMSTIDTYKHQDAVVRAAAILAGEGLALAVDLVGPQYGPAARDLRRVMRECDPSGSVVRIVGAVPHARVKSLFQEFDGAVFASSCESFGIPLIDGLHAGLPTACSNRSTLPEIASDAAVYFDPGDARSVAEAMRRIMTDPSLRADLVRRGAAVAAKYDWARSAAATLQFIAGVARSAPTAAVA